MIARVLFAIAFVLSLASIAAPASAADDEKPPSSVDQIRIGFGGGYARGSELVGAGSRKPYALGFGVMEFDARSFSKDGVGVEADFDLVPANYSHSIGTPFVRMDLGVLWAPLRVDPAHVGDTGGSFALGVGGGLVGGERYWTEKIRLYPLLLARGRVLFGDGWAIDLGAGFAPVDTPTSNDLVAREVRTELGVGYGLVQFAVRWGHFWVRGGDPVRTYPENEAFGMIALVIR